MAAQSEQKALMVRPNEQQGQSVQRSSSGADISRRQRSPLFGIGLAPDQLFSTNPISLMQRMTEEMSRLIQEFGLERDDGSRTDWSPAIEVTQRDGKYSVRAELSGLAPSDVKVEVAKDTIILQGERKLEHEEKDEGVLRTERQYGFFYRSIPLPEGADVERASARLHDGILEVTIPVPQRKEERRAIPIETKSAETQKQAA
jgi:HSP20 family protein